MFTLYERELIKTFGICPEKAFSALYKSNSS